MKLRAVFHALALGCLATATGYALVTPNPASLLSEKRVLVIDGTHSSHADARNAMTAKLNQIKNAVGFTMTRVTNPPTTLNNYDIIVFNYWFDNHNSNFAAFQNAFQNWIRSGNKGWVGYHTSGANEQNEWNWLRDSVTSLRYILHSSAAQTGKVGRTTDQSILNLPIMQALADSFSGQDEWYEFAATAPTWPDVKVMYYLNEKSLARPLEHPMDPHPMAWFREDRRGNRFFYTAMIHTSAGVNSTAGNDFFPSLVLRALEYTAGYSPTTITLNGQGLYNGGTYMHLTRGDLRVEHQEPYRLEIRSLQGRLLYSGNGEGPKTHRVEGLLEPGLYFISISSRKHVHTQKVMVQ